MRTTPAYRTISIINNAPMQSNLQSSAMSRNRDSMDRTDDSLALMQCLRNALDRLDAINAFTAAAHLDACLHALSDYFISDENHSKGD
ncbi:MULTISPECIES: hypothetical protein [unclassified Novosphingobium]|uniref:hypothetical protein n=2 Tax=unclassified Novosphingobium TaxID=2644732 RepID=UPI001C13095C|nr:MULTISPECIES: hypothetical protein [unclassified Novosphingobium]